MIYYYITQKEIDVYTTSFPTIYKIEAESIKDAQYRIALLLIEEYGIDGEDYLENPNFYNNLISDLSYYFNIILSMPKSELEIESFA